MNIVVLAGGFGKERQVSLSSGGMVARALREAGHDVIRRFLSRSQGSAGGHNARV